MRRKRASCAPSFQEPAGYSPIGGKYAMLGVEGVYPRVAIFQVVQEDIYDHYLMCRGYNPETGKFHGVRDPETGEMLSTIRIAKPYDMRGVKRYRIGEVIYCAKQRWQFFPTVETQREAIPEAGLNAGKAQTTVGHPADLDEPFVPLIDHEDKSVEWTEIGSRGTGLFWCMLMETHPGRYVCFDILVGQWCWEEYRYRFDCAADPSTYEVGIDLHYTVSAGGTIPEPAQYAQGWFQRMPAKYTTSGYVYVVVSLDCESDGVCTPTHDIPCQTGTDPCGA